MSEQVHRRIAEEAYRRGLLDRSDWSQVLVSLGRRLETDESVEIEFWVDRNWLEPAQLSEILDALGLPVSNATEQRDTFPGDETSAQRETGDWGEDQPETDPQFEAEGETDGEDDAADSRRREPVAAPGGDEGAQSGPSTSEPESSETVDTLTDAPIDYLDDVTFGGEGPVNLDSLPPGAEPAAADADTIVRDDSDDSGSFENQTSAPGGFHPERVIVEAVREDTSIRPGERFVLRRELGSGGSGRVVRAFDRLLGRSVAMKIVRADAKTSPAALSRFVAEAQATGQLEHPNIVPIYDFGVLPSGDVFYTMREVKGHSLRDVLTGLSEGREEYERDYTLVRLLNILRQVGQAAEYAHVRSVVHRDLKPDNVMLGDFGEVLVMDWGLAQVLHDEEYDLDPEEELSKNPDSTTLGTPSYMPPEQARGDLEEVDETSDIYSLGAILYEILTLQAPYSGDDPLEVMWAVVDSELVPPSERAPTGRDVPEGLERICLKAMADEQSERFDSAGAFHEELEAWLEGLKPRESSRRVRKGDEAAERYQRLLTRIEELNDEVRHISTKVDDWKPIDEKQNLWELENKRDETEAESARAFCEAVTQYTQALAHDPDNDAANRGLADLYWTRLRRAEMRRDVLNTIYFKTLVEQYDPGIYDELLTAKSELSVSTEPEGVELEFFEYEERERRLVPTNARNLGPAPTAVEDLPIGSYLLKLHPEQRRKIQQPIFIERDRPAEVHVRLPTEDDFEEGFRYIPGGTYISGGDPEAFAPRRPERVDVDPFFCKTLPVTFREYLEWFNELYDERGEEAMVRAPKTREAEGLLVRRDDELEQWVPDEVLIEGSARERYPEGEGHEWDLPVIGIRAVDAEAYCEWRSQRDERPYRLPTVHELEKAGRGVDGRRFPWGNAFDATFCKMRFSRPDNPPQPEPVGVFETDRSPYGVRDLAGGVQEWCQRLADDHEGHRPTKGGGWGQDQRVSHLASTVEVLAAARNARIGFRIVYEPSFSDE